MEKTNINESYFFALGSNENSMVLEKGAKKLEKSISDETLLKELNLLDKEITIYDILSLIIVVEQKESNPYGEFKCYFKNETKEFYIEINESTPIKVFTRSILLNLFDFAEKKGAKIIYVCLRNTANDIIHYTQSFLFVGFELADQEKKISSNTHIILKYEFENSLKQKFVESNDEIFEE